MTSDINYIDIFQFLNWSYKKLFSLLIKIWCFHKKSSQPVLKKRVSYMRVLTVFKEAEK